MFQLEQTGHFRPISQFSLLIALITFILEVSFMSNAKADTPQNQTQTPITYFIQLKGTRADWPKEPWSDKETKAMSDHFDYLKDLTAKGKVLAAGPVLPLFGLVILRVNSEAEALEIMAKEPSVVAGVHTYEMTPLILALQAHNIYKNRYPAEISDRVLYKEVTVKAPLDSVWNAWTTNEGAHEFFSPYTNIQLRTGGPFEIYFSNDGELGMRGSEGCKVLSFLPKSMFSFEWNAPPQFGPLRYIYTRVVINFEALGSDSTKVKFSHLGWGTDLGWDEIYNYFDRAWGYVLGNLAKRFETGPINWED